MSALARYAWLFWINFAISAFTFGGGYVVIPMLRKAFVEKKRLFSESELMDMAAVAQSSPGAIAINLATLAGRRVAGAGGAVVSCLAAVTPPLLILSLVSLAYAEFRDSRLVAAALKGMEAGVAALIVDLVVDMCRAVFRRKDLLASVLIPAAFVGSFLLRLNVALILAASVLLALAEGWWRSRGTAAIAPAKES